jgi:uncharacterized membrane protein YjjP (DUF1212 family)
MNDGLVKPSGPAKVPTWVYLLMVAGLAGLTCYQLTGNVVASCISGLSSILGGGVTHGVGKLKGSK